jgi:hypothetical protein
MSAPRPLEEDYLRPCEEIIAKCSANSPEAVRDEIRLGLLERCSSLIGGFELNWYLRSSDLNGLRGHQFAGVAQQLSDALVQLPMHHALALAALARPSLERTDKRREGAYYTDFRLAEFLCSKLSVSVHQQLSILDPASGTGILLVAAVLKLSRDSKLPVGRILADSIFGADLSRRAIRGASLALCSLTSSRTTIKSLRKHLRIADSLLRRDLWRDLGPNGFDVVLGNPPWEKLKLSRHEFLIANGVQRHYGGGYDKEFIAKDYGLAQSELAKYSDGVEKNYSLQGSGEADLYKLFLELSLSLAREGGHIGLIVPAGLIRSLGTAKLRRFLMDGCADIEYTIFDNKARFFEIDTRFKFVVLRARLCNGHALTPIELSHARPTGTSILSSPAVHIPRNILPTLRPDLSIPELRSQAEFNLFRKLCEAGPRFGDSEGIWRPKLMREVDMTRDAGGFRRTTSSDAIPIIEGRMIHQFRHSAKHYISGTGRRAIWKGVAQNSPCELHPQFWYPTCEIPDSARKRVGTQRFGFCDITGQTNERTMLASTIPGGVICGNKVPTICFDGEDPEFIGYSWLAIANSFIFDWLLRRVVTTTVNYFILLDLPLPHLDHSDLTAQRLARAANELSACSHSGNAASRSARRPNHELRTEIDLLVLRLYGLGLSSLELVLADFPLIDRSQPTLKGEAWSTITRDVLLWRAGEEYGEAGKKINALKNRVESAFELGATPYVPAQLNS